MRRADSPKYNWCLVQGDPLVQAMSVAAYVLRCDQLLPRRDAAHSRCEWFELCPPNPRQPPHTSSPAPVPQPGGWVS